MPIWTFVELGLQPVFEASDINPEDVFGTKFSSLVGDNTAAMEVRALRQRRLPESDSEEGASIRGLRGAYARAAGVPLAEAPEPREVFEIGMGLRPGPR